MASTKTFLSSDCAAGAQFVTLSAYTAPTWSGNLAPKYLLRFADTGEICLIVDSALSPTLQVVRGYMGTAAVAHKANTGVEYGLPSDMQTSEGPTFSFPNVANPTIAQNVAEMTATGATGSTAAPVILPAPSFLNVTGTSGAGINLPYATPGAFYVIRNATTGVLKVYSVGATINGTTGTTAKSITATGNLTAIAECSTAGAWYVALDT